MISQVIQLFKFLWPFCKSNKKYFYGLSALILINVALELPLPLFMRYFVDHIIKNKDLSHLKLFTLVLIVLVIFKFLIDNLQQYNLFSFKENTFIALQTYLFEKLMKVKFKFFEENSPGYMVSRIHTEVLQLQGFLWDFSSRSLPILPCLLLVSILC